MEKIVHKSGTRGYSKHNWLESYHTFSFGGYYDNTRTRFGTLRVLNDDKVAPGMGFGTHPHRDMEIITIVLKGELKHEDSMGNVDILKPGDIQAMSAGKGITHSEFNNSNDEHLEFLQIWILTDSLGHDPRYADYNYTSEQINNQFHQIVSPFFDDDGTWIHQQAFFFIGQFEAGKLAEYELKRFGNGIYVFVIEGAVIIDKEKLNARDGIGIANVQEIELRFTEKSNILVMDVPMQ